MLIVTPICVATTSSTWTSSPRSTSSALRSRPVKADQYRVSGDLTIKGMTKPVSIDFEYTGAAVDPYQNQRVGFEGTVTVNRKDWGISWNAALEAGGVLVSENVVLEFEIAAVKKVS